MTAFFSLSRFLNLVKRISQICALLRNMFVTVPLFSMAIIESTSLKSNITVSLCLEKLIIFGIFSDKDAHGIDIEHLSNIASFAPPISRPKTLPCRYCQKVFWRPADVRQHERTHTGERPYRCSVCTMTFRQKTTLDQHMIRHTGEKKFVCQMCEKKFGRKFQLRRHLLSVHGIGFE